MKILLIKPEKAPRAAEIDGSLKSMQEIVNGMIEVIYPFEEEIALFCNDEGKLLGLPLNRALRDEETGTVCEIIAGTFFLCGAPASEGTFTSLTDAQMLRYSILFAYPELFLSINGKIIAVPVKKV